MKWEKKELVYSINKTISSETILKHFISKLGNNTKKLDA